MNLKKLAIAAAAGTTLLAAAPVFAQSRHDHRDHWRGSSHNWRGDHRHHHRHHYGHYRARGYYMPPPRAYYTPRTPYYYSPGPSIYGRVPLGHGASIGFSLPLNDWR